MFAAVQVHLFFWIPFAIHVMKWGWCPWWLPGLPKPRNAKDSNCNVCIWHKGRNRWRIMALKEACSQCRCKSLHQPMFCLSMMIEYSRRDILFNTEAFSSMLHEMTGYFKASKRWRCCVISSWHLLKAPHEWAGTSHFSCRSVPVPSILLASTAFFSWFLRLRVRDIGKERIKKRK